MIASVLMRLYSTIEKKHVWKTHIKSILQKLGFGKLFWSLMALTEESNHVYSEIIRPTFSCYYYKILRSSRTFRFQGKEYVYFCHKYNNTWLNERTVEVPIVWEIVRNHHGKRILEVGNVLSHYFSVNHDVLDKYEKADGVINQDVVDFHPSKKYELIVSISTLEHVGWDESPRDPAKILRAIENLKGCLAEGGKMIVTLPLGQNPEMDRLLQMGKIEFTSQYCLKRISKSNKWIKVAWGNVQNAKYNYPFSSANGLIIGVIGEQI